MRELNLSLPVSKKPYYLRIAEALRRAIINGLLKPDEALPSSRELARTLKVHRHTVMAALEELAAEGWVTAKQRRLYQVSRELPDRFFNPEITGSAHKRVVAAHNWRITRAIGEKLVMHNPASFNYNFQSGMPDLRLFPHNEFRAFLAESYKRTSVKILGYGDAAGHPPFVQAVKTYIRRARAISGREIIVTHGSQEGIYLTAQLLIKPGDYVAVERLGYRPAWEALRAAGATLVPVNIDQDGIDPDALEKILQRKKIRLLYVTLLHQYPTTVTLAIPRRMRLYELAARYGVPILEDDYDHEFHYRSQPLAPLASRDPAEQIIYVSTFSKNLYPSARLGFIAAPVAIAEKLKAAKQVISRQNDLLLQDAVAQWIQDGGFEKHLRRMRRVYEQRRETMLECIRRGIERGLPLSCNEPDGGMAVWLRVKTCTDNLMQQLAVRGVKVTSESAYSLKPGKAEHLRLGFANQRPEEIQAGMDILFKMLS